MGFNKKVNAELLINDSMFVFTDKDKDKSIRYYVKKGLNNEFYISDGILQDILYVVDEKGKVKGFNYDTFIMLRFDEKKRLGDVYYYATKSL